MIPLISDNKDAIARLCREYRIKRLDLFGSAATGEFDPETSDIDFIVDLGGYEPGVSRRYFRFIDALERLFGRMVDLIADEQVRNPYFRQAVEEQKTLVYEAVDPDWHGQPKPRHPELVEGSLDEDRSPRKYGGYLDYGQADVSGQ